MPNFFINILTKGAKKSEKDIKGLNRALGSLKSQAMMAAGAFLGAGALVAGIKKATDAFGEQELAEKKLQQALGSSTQALLQQASALQQTSVFGDEATIAQQAFLASLKFSEEQIKTIIPVAMDLASATGMSLESAVRNTAKTFSGLAGELGEMVPQLRELTAEEMKAGRAVEVMAELFGGAAKAETETMTGSLQQMSNAVGDAAESIGGLLSPAVIAIADTLKFFAEGTQSVIDALRFDEALPELVAQLTDVEVKTEEFRKTISGLTSEELMKFVSSLNEEVAPSLSLWTEETELVRQKQIALREELAKNPEKIQAVERRNAADMHLKNLKKIEVFEVSSHVESQKRKEKSLKDDLKNAALSGQSASDAMKSVVRAKLMESIASAMASVFKNPAIPFPLNMIAAAGVGTALTGLADKAIAQIPSFATGGDFVTNGSQMIMVGDNPSGRERVQVTPLDAGGEPTGAGGAVNITFNSPVMSADYTEDVIIPQIAEAVRRGASLGVS